MPAGQKIITWSYYFAIALLLVSIPLSKFTMSISQFLLTVVFIVDGISKKDVILFFQKHSKPKAYLLAPFVGAWWILEAVVRKFRVFFHRENAPAWVFSSLWLLHLIGLLYTTDMEYAMRDVRIKLPLLLLPLFLSTTERIDRKAFPWLMFLFFAALAAGTFISSWLFFTRDAHDLRDASPFISHIRFSLLVDIAVFALIFMISKRGGLSLPLRILLSVALAWFVAFLFISTSMTGLVVLLLTGSILAIILLFIKIRKWLKTVIAVSMVAMLALVGAGLWQVWQAVSLTDQTDLQNLEKTTALGNPYWHDLSNPETENGHYVWIYLATDEMREAWNKRSGLDFDGKDRAGQELRFTLMRFLSSKGYRKDAAGVEKLTEREVRLIEQGVASTVFAERSGLYVRAYKIFWEYRRYTETGNPSGHSVMQRIEYWKAAKNIILRNWLIGVGTGDPDLEFSQEYVNMNSKLEEGVRWRSHNQFLAMTVAFGFPGLAWFIVTLVFPAFRLRKFQDYYFLTFFIIIVLSMFAEDTLETQAGATIYAFFTSFYLFARKFIDPI